MLLARNSDTPLLRGSICCIRAKRPQINEQWHRGSAVVSDTGADCGESTRLDSNLISQLRIKDLKLQLDWLAAQRFQHICVRPEFGEVDVALTTVALPFTSESCYQSLSKALQ